MAEGEGWIFVGACDVGMEGRLAAGISLQSDQDVIRRAVFFLNRQKLAVRVGHNGEVERLGVWCLAAAKVVPVGCFRGE